MGSADPKAMDFVGQFFVIDNFKHDILFFVAKIDSKQSGALLCHSALIAKKNLPANRKGVPLSEYSLFSFSVLHLERLQVYRQFIS